MNGTVSIDAVKTARTAGVQYRVTRTRELRVRTKVALVLLRMAARIGCFRFEFVETIPLRRAERRRGGRGV